VGPTCSVEIGRMVCSVITLSSARVWNSTDNGGRIASLLGTPGDREFLALLNSREGAALWPGTQPLEVVIMDKGFGMRTAGLDRRRCNTKSGTS
jgi:hypothetical protein